MSTGFLVNADTVLRGRMVRLATSAAVRCLIDITVILR